MSEATPQSEGSSIGKFLGKMRRKVILTDEEIQKHKEFSKECTKEVQKRIDQLHNSYGNIASLAEQTNLFQIELIRAKTEYLKIKEREETADISEELKHFEAYLDELYQTSELKKLVDEHDAKPKGKILDITKRIEERVHKAS